MVLSEFLKEKGQTVAIFDSPKNNKASAIAAGSINPVSFKRMILSWNARQLLDVAIPFYESIGQNYGEQIIREITAIRVHASENEAVLWNTRMLEEPIGNYLSNLDAPLNVNAPYGCGKISDCYWLDIQRFLELHASHWSDHIIEENAHSIDRVDDDFLVNGISGGSVIHCTGAYEPLPGLIPVQGEVLTLHIPGLNITSSLHRSCFLLPLGKDNYRLGSTFEWDDVWAGPTAKGRSELLGRLAQLTSLPFEILEHGAGTRPTTKDRRPLIGEHPNRQGEYVFNGLGSRGALLAPWCAQAFYHTISSGDQMESAIDSKRFVST